MKKSEAYIKVWMWEEDIQEYVPHTVEYETAEAAKEAYDLLRVHAELPQISWGMHTADGWKVKEMKEAWV